MIISHKYKFIFIKTYKTGGTSVEIALSKFCGPDDVITAIAPEDEKLRAQVGGRGPQNCGGPALPLIGDLLARPHQWQKNLRRLCENEAFYNHIGAAAIRRRISPAIWNGYYKFCFERNPWDKVVSDYFWKKKSTGREMSFGDYIGTKSLPLNYKLYSIGGRVAVDRVGRFENLTEDLADICGHLGVPFDGQLPNAKGGVRPEKASYRDIYSEDQRQQVAQFFKKEIDLFGYGF